MRAVLRRNQEPTDPAPRLLRSDELEVDPARHEVRLRGPDPERRKAAVRLLGEIGPAAAPAKKLAHLGKNLELISRARIEIEACRLMVLRAAKAMDTMGNAQARVWIMARPSLNQRGTRAA